jgi:hypothetical protein
LVDQRRRGDIIQSKTEIVSLTFPLVQNSPVKSQPDVLVDIDPEAFAHGSDAQLNRAIDVLQ